MISNTIAQLGRKLILTATDVSEGEEHELVNIPLEEGDYRVIKTKPHGSGVEYRVANPWGDQITFDSGEDAELEAVLVGLGRTAARGNPEAIRSELRRLMQQNDGQNKK